MLVHICCSVDSHFFLQKLQKLYPHETLIGFFYDPNIHPMSEYQLRLLDVRRSCQKLGITLYEGVYNYEGWVEAVRGLEEEPEKGKRCEVCFDNRLEESARKALEIGQKMLTTTLLTSPKKSLQQLAYSLNVITEKYGLESVVPDFRKNGGTQEQFALAKKDQLYHQDYCGCFFALSKQRDMQQRWCDELCAPLNAQVLPSSIEDRMDVYEKVIVAEAHQQNFKLRREKFLNYRLLRAWVKKNSEGVIPSYILFYSTIKKESLKGRIESIRNDVGYFTKEEVLFVSLASFNKTMKTAFKNVKEMLFNPPSIAAELHFRAQLLQTPYVSLSAIIILDELCVDAYELYLATRTYPDIRENLVLIGYNN
ncbi:MAG: epoxyqueuosine reductase QueH [Sulfurospirillum sp.]|jgi:predicted adenine nucleotide alpha hydrolase (AANH) superfamily ATPase|nr:epoxyqueuosine reductase QueH [Sulfurospirillum sp.]MBP9492363.1 epoxyqueuosine reductase QueH [Sulfurospirillum sp.]